MYAAVILAVSLSVHHPALAQMSDPGPSGGGTCRPVVPEAGSLTWSTNSGIGWPGWRALFDTGARWSQHLAIRGRSLPFLIRRRAGS
jgi:hypothetical protein